jgi:4-amino-4-deoxy-L-arabinose transferase-like glycosyltransferase
MALPSFMAGLSSRERALVVLALLAVLASFFFMLGRAPLFDVDEGAFSQATLEMFQRGDFLSTYLNGQPRYDKPILIYWLQAACVLAFGVTELAFRLPSAVCATLWALATFLFVRRFFDLERAMLAVALLATSLGVYIVGRAATADALLNCLIAAAMFSAWLHLSTGRRGWLYATHAAIGLGFLAKGPVAILVPVAVTFVFCVLRRDLKTWARGVFDPRALALALAIALPWYVAIFMQEGWAFFEGFFMKHNVSRFGGPMQGHAGSLIYYFPVLIISTLPFTALLIPVGRRLKTIWRDDLQTFLLLWFGFVFVFFSLSGTKLPHYLLYGITGLSILMAVHADGLKSRFWAFTPGFLFFVVLLALPRIAAVVAARIPDPFYREALANADAYFNAGYFAAAALGALATLVAMFERRIAIAHKLAGIGVAGVVIVSAFLVPVLAGLQQSPIVEAAQLSRARGLEPILWRLNAPSFSIYRGEPTPTRDPRPGDVVLTRAKRLAELTVAGYGHEVLYAKNGIVLVRITG